MITSQTKVLKTILRLSCNSHKTTTQRMNKLSLRCNTVSVGKFSNQCGNASVYNVFQRSAHKKTQLQHHTDDFLHIVPLLDQSIQLDCAESGCDCYGYRFIRKRV